MAGGVDRRKFAASRTGRDHFQSPPWFKKAALIDLQAALDDYANGSSPSWLHRALPAGYDFLSTFFEGGAGSENRQQPDPFRLSLQLQGSIARVREPYNNRYMLSTLLRKR